MPEVGLPTAGVPQTTTPRSLAAAPSIEALRMPVVIRSLRSGSFSITARGKPVRSRMAHDDLEALQRLDDIVRAAEMLAEHLDVEIARDLRPIGQFEGNVLVVVEDRAAVARHGGMSVVGRSRQREETPTTHAKSRQIAMGVRNGPVAGSNGKLDIAGLVKADTGSSAGADQPFTRTRTSAGIASKEAVGRSCLACHLGPGPRI